MLIKKKGNKVTIACDTDEQFKRVMYALNANYEYDVLTYCSYNTFLVTLRDIKYVDFLENLLSKCLAPIIL